MSNPSATRAAGELARLRRCISAIERRADTPPARPPMPWSAGEEEDWSAHDWNQENGNRENENREGWNWENGTGADGGRSHGDGDDGRNGGPWRGADREAVPACAPGARIPAASILNGSSRPAPASSAASQTRISGDGSAHGGHSTGARAQNQTHEQDQAREREPAQEHAPLNDPSASLSPPHPLLPLGLPPLDAALGGGLALGALHEAAARGPGAEAALTAFALALAARAAFQLKRPVLMVQHELAELEGGSLYAPGLAELGLCGGALVLVRVRKPQDVLFAMEEGLKCGGLSAVLGEVGTAFPEALTATRRLSLAARAHPVLGLLLRQRPDPAACAALTRWAIAPTMSTPHDSYGGLGLPTLEAALMRNRLGPLGRWTLSLAGPAFLSAAPARAVPHHPSHAREAGS
ncbi:ImuA family protein [Roseixanthobacter glucoisosaccharinicivorans]|uniref:ImuA family protein n=1 Tax=Roseixanthobacter glucoisosaccharinicivorans TaxID=3119923 RepID=UPI003728A671